MQADNSSLRFGASLGQAHCVASGSLERKDVALRMQTASLRRLQEDLASTSGALASWAPRQQRPIDAPFY